MCSVEGSVAVLQDLQGALKFLSAGPGLGSRWSLEGGLEWNVLIVLIEVKLFMIVLMEVKLLMIVLMGCKQLHFYFQQLTNSWLCCVNTRFSVTTPTSQTNAEQNPLRDLANPQTVLRLLHQDYEGPPAVTEETVESVLWRGCTWFWKSVNQLHLSQPHGSWRGDWE